ncbi:MAG TPA: hypothetical protein VGK48_14350 [Terriglobia bacterium]|jgi:hypothetical protein
MIPAWKWIVMATVACTVVTGFAFWHSEHGHKPVTNAVTIYDASGSTTNEYASVLGVAEVFFNTPHLSKGSMLTVLLTGDDKSAGEPRMVATYEVPFSRRALEGKNAINKRKADIVTGLSTKLKELGRTDRSPIFLAVKRGVEQLRASGCHNDSRCFLFVRTDGEELTEKSIRVALNSSGMAKNLPAPITIEGIQVLFCGLAETDSTDTKDKGNARPVHNAKHDDRLREVWTSLFTAPAQVTFQPYCPKSQAVEQLVRN